MIKRKILLPVVFSIVFSNISFSQEDVLAEIVDIKFAEKVVNRVPVNVSTKFPSSIKRVYCWTKVRAFKVPTYIVHQWYYKGKLMASVKLDIRSPLFRTWSSKRIIPAWKGKWRVIVKDANGSIVASKEFLIK